MRFVEVDTTTHEVVGEFKGPIISRRDARDGAIWVEHYEAKMGLHRLDITQSPPVMSDEPGDTPQKRYHSDLGIETDGFNAASLDIIDARIDQIDTMAELRAALKKIVRLIIKRTS